jgi:hypothetical protein
LLKLLFPFFLLLYWCRLGFRYNLYFSVRNVEDELCDVEGLVLGHLAQAAGQFNVQLE